MTMAPCFLRRLRVENREPDALGEHRACECDHSNMYFVQK